MLKAEGSFYLSQPLLYPQVGNFRSLFVSWADWPWKTLVVLLHRHTNRLQMILLFALYCLRDGCRESVSMAEREHQWHPVRIRFLFDAWTKHCRNRTSAIPIPRNQKTLRENVNGGLFYWYYSFKSIVWFFPTEFLLGSLWNDSLSSLAALASVSHTSTSQRNLPALPLSSS